MKTRYLISSILIVLGLLLGLGTVMMAVTAIDAPVRLIGTPEEALERVQTMMDAICDGDYETASTQIYGSPDLGSSPENADETVFLIWDTYRKSFSYDIQSEPRPDDSGVSIDVIVRSLDVSAVLGELGSAVQARIDETRNAAQDDEAGFRASSSLRREEVEGILQQTLAEALEKQEHFQEQLMTIDLIYDRGQWWARPNGDLMDMLAGSFLE